MSNETTSAVERAARTLSVHIGATQSSGWDRVVARATVAAALNDPGDPDSLARTLWVLDRQALGLTPVSPTLFDQSPSRKHWRAVADGVRTTLLGGAA